MLLRLAFSMIVIVISICCINNSISFASQNDTSLPAQPIQPHPDEQSHSGEKNVVEQVEQIEKVEDEHIRCLQK